MDTTDKFLMCPIYELEGGNTPEIQNIITGKVKVMENVSRAMVREVGEEIGLKIPDTIVRKNNKNVFFINLEEYDDILFSKDDIRNTFIDNFKDTKTRVKGFVYCNKDIMERYINSEILRLPDKKEETVLISVAFIPLEVALKMDWTPTSGKLSGSVYHQ
jgi:hypothetical protein